MKTVLILICTLAGFAFQGHAIDGQLPPAIKKKIAGSLWDLDYNGATADVIVNWLNERNVAKIIIDPKLGKVIVPVFSLTKRTILEGAEILALHLPAKTFAVGDNIHICTERPAGTNAGGITPPPPVAGPAVQPPPNGGGGQPVKPPPGPKGPFTPGSNTSFSWSRANIDGCKSAKKPVLLYIYDKDVKTSNSLPEYLETVLFPDANLQKSLSGFTFVKLERTEKSWPPAFMDRAHNGAALFLLTCDGTPVGSWDKGAERPTPQIIAVAVQRANGENPKAIARVEKEVAAGAKLDPGPGEEEKKKITVPGLAGLGGDEEKKSGEPKPKKTVVNAMGDE